MVAPAEGVVMVSEESRRKSLVEHMLSAAVQVQVPAEATEVPAQLSAREVEKVFTDHVPGVRGFLFRQKPGQPSLKFIAGAYQNGLQAFRGTALHNHLTWLLRHTVHYALSGGPLATAYLTEVAEAFMDCQAVQGRAIERVGLKVLGIATDFRGLVTRLVGEYKSLALKMLAAERVAQGYAEDRDANPTHYENRLTADLGDLLGLNAGDVRRAELDEHARSRFPCLDNISAETAAARCREIFDLDALLDAFVAEVNSLSTESPPESLPRLLLQWVPAYMTHRETLLDEATCTRMEVDHGLARCILEVLFLGAPKAPEEEVRRGVPLRHLFGRPALEEDVALARSHRPCTKRASPWGSLRLRQYLLLGVLGLGVLSSLFHDSSRAPSYPDRACP